MAGFKSIYLCNKLLDLELGAVSWTPPSSVWIRLYTTLPNPDGTGGVEVAGGGYTAYGVVNNTTNFPAASGGFKTNGVDFVWAAPAAAWGTLVGAAMWDAAFGGNMLRCGPFSMPFVVNGGDPAFRINAGAGHFGEA